MAHRLSAEAERDLEDIAYSIARETGNLTIADRLVDSIATRFLLLADHPRIGRARDDVASRSGATSSSIPWTRKTY
jgi:plasmid stabilization system protein ParE